MLVCYCIRLWAKGGFRPSFSCVLSCITRALLLNISTKRTACSYAIAYVYGLRVDFVPRSRVSSRVLLARYFSVFPPKEGHSIRLWAKGGQIFQPVENSSVAMST